MEVSRIRALRGPNLWSRHTAIEAIVYCDEEERSIDQMPGFETRLRERFPELAMLRPAGHDEAISMAQALEFAALGLQAQAGCPVTFSRSTQTLETGIYQVVVEYSGVRGEPKASRTSPACSGRIRTAACTCG